MTAPDAWAMGRLTVDAPAELVVRTVQVLARLAVHELHKDLARDGLRVASRVTLAVQVDHWLDGSRLFDLTVTAAAADVRAGSVRRDG